MDLRASKVKQVLCGGEYLQLNKLQQDFSNPRVEILLRL